MIICRMVFVLVTAALLTGAGLPTLHAEDAAAKAKSRATATSLVEDANRALAYVVKAIQQGKQLDAKNPRHQPFLTSLRSMSLTIDQLGKGLTDREARFHVALSQANEDCAQLIITWPRCGVTNEKVKEGISALAESLDELRDHYGKEALRRKKGGPLSEKERAHAAAIESRAKRMAAELTAFQRQVEEKEDKAFAAELQRLVKELKQLERARDTLDGYLWALVWLDTFEGEWAAYSYYVAPQWRGAWKTVSGKFQQDFEAWDVVYTEFEEVVVVEEWSYLNTEVEIETDVEVEIELAEVEEYELMAEAYEEVTVDEYYEEVEEDLYEEEVDEMELEDEDEMDEDEMDEGEDEMDEDEVDVDDDEGGDEEMEGGDDGGDDDAGVDMGDGGDEE